MIFFYSYTSNIREYSHKNRICAVNSNGASLVDCTFLVKMILKIKWLLNKRSFRHVFEYWRRVSSCYNSMLKIQTDLIIMQIVCSSTPFFAPANSPYLTIILPRLFSWKHWTKPTSDNKSFINNKIALILGAVHKCDHQRMEGVRGDLDLSMINFSEKYERTQQGNLLGVGLVKRWQMMTWWHGGGREKMTLNPNPKSK